MFMDLFNVLKDQKFDLVVTDRLGDHMKMIKYMEIPIYL